MQRRTRLVLIAVDVLATVQLVWCYLWLTRPYVNTALYEQGLERMPFQGRALMMLPMRWAHASDMLRQLSLPFALSRFWFPRPVQPEVIVQALIDISCLLLAGYLTTKIYEASSRDRLLTPLVYPLFLATCAATYIMHTVQNFRFLYDLPSLAFFACSMYLLYFRKPVSWFATLFVVATINRETTLLLLPLYLISRSVEDGRFQPRRLLSPRSLSVVVPLAVFWGAWQLVVRRVFALNASEFYPRLDWNVKSLLAPLAWPQMLSACGYLLVFVVLLRRRLPDPQLRAWLWLIPVWIVFMFSYGILIETRVFGELIPFVVCAAALILEQSLAARMRSRGSITTHAVSPIRIDRAA